MMNQGEIVKNLNPGLYLLCFDGLNMVAIEDLSDATAEETAHRIDIQQELMRREAYLHRVIR